LPIFSKNLAQAEKNLLALGADYSGVGKVFLYKRKRKLSKKGKRFFGATLLSDAGECAQWIVALRHLLLAVQNTLKVCKYM
jgi:hypothetical protein